MEENIVFIGGKSFGIYNQAILKKMSQSREVIVKTRGKYITSAVNIVTFLESINKLKIKSTKIFGTKFESDGQERFVPEIEITLTR